MKRLRRLYYILAAVLLMVLCGCAEGKETASTEMSEADYESMMQEAETTPYGKYPETIYYTLGKVTGEISWS